MENQDNPIAKFIRLQNGDDIIAETVEIEDEDGILYMVYNPLKVMYMDVGSGLLSVSFIPWVFPKICEHQEFTIHAQDVLLLSDVSAKMNDYYWNNLLTMDQRITDKIPEEQTELENALSELENYINKGTMH